MIIVSGGESGLGAELMKREGTVNLPRSVIRAGKFAIDDWFINQKQPFFGLINNFGINHLSWIGRTPEADAEILAVNVLAPYWIINSLVSQGYVCRVINIASAAHRVPMRCSSLYCASKAALVQLTKVMARELAPSGWVINCLAPGMMEETEMGRLTVEQVKELRGWDATQADQYAKSLIPMGRFTSIEEVAGAVWKVYDLPDYINGTTIEMMGAA